MESRESGLSVFAGLSEESELWLVLTHTGR